ncbi:uncharacterized protein LOC119193108, partial [Manduca sexta]
DATDFLNAERAHADLTRAPPRDPNLLSDDEVFLDSAASTTSGPLSPMSPIDQPAITRVQVVHRTVGRAPGREDMFSDDEVFLEQGQKAPPQGLFTTRAQHIVVHRALPRGEHTVNGDHSDAHQSTFSHSSK